MRSGYREACPGTCARVFKRQISTIMKDAVPKGVRAVRQFHRVIENVCVRCEQVLEAVIVKVKKARAPRSQMACVSGQSRRATHVFKLAVTKIVIDRKALAKHRGLEDIGLAVVIDVAKVCPHARNRVSKSVIGNACEHSNFSESSVSVVVQQVV